MISISLLDDDEGNRQHIFIVLFTTGHISPSFRPFFRVDGKDDRSRVYDFVWQHWQDKGEKAVPPGRQQF